MDLLHGIIAAGEGGQSVYSTAFPQYDSWFGKMVGQFLNGDFGPLDTLDPHFTALLYAGDRFESKPRLESALQAGKIVLVDRYIGSNLAHQTARVAPEKRAEFRRRSEERRVGKEGRAGRWADHRKKDAVQDGGSGATGEHKVREDV